MTFLSSLTKLDGPVMIEWRDTSRSEWWRRYRIIGLDYPAGWIRLRGVAAPGEPEFTDGPFWVPLSDIAMIEEARHED